MAGEDDLVRQHCPLIADGDFVDPLADEPDVLRIGEGNELPQQPHAVRRGKLPDPAVREYPAEAPTGFSETTPGRKKPRRVAMAWAAWAGFSNLRGSFSRAR
ncbi:MAG: hypothetical protein ABSB76_04525 [Streptosporangiaceae bacterium]